MFSNFKVWLNYAFFHRAKCICFYYSLYKKEIEKLQILQKNAYLNWFINKIIAKFEDCNFNNTNNCDLDNLQKIEKEFLFTFDIQYTRIGKTSHTFFKNLRTLIESKFNVDLNIYFKSFKIVSYFQLKCSTPI